MGRSDIEIAREARLQPILSVAATLGLDDDDIEPYDRHKAKVRLETVERFRSQAARIT